MAPTRYVKLVREVPEDRAMNVFKDMRNMDAENVIMESIEQKKDSQGNATAQKKCKITGFFWAEEALPSLEEVPSG